MDQDKKFLPVAVAKQINSTTEKSDGAQEHQITFVASSTSEDRAHEIVQIDTFRLPLKSGGHIRVSELASVPDAKLDIPFANHDGWDIDSVLGSVRKAEYKDSELIFTVGISSRDKAQDIFTLVKEQHLDNDFSIGWRGGAFNPDTKTYTDGEMLEVSLVTRGCNYDARVLEAKGLNTEQTKSTEDIPVEDAGESTEDKANSADENAEDNTNQTNQEQETEQTMDGEKTNQTEVAKAQVMDAPNQKVEITGANAKAYLDTPEAVKDFTRHIINHKGESGADVLHSWAETLRGKGLEGSEILPTTIHQTFFDAFERRDGFLGKIIGTKALTGAAYAFKTADRAGAHTKGNKKNYITPKDIRRDYKYKIGYGKMSLDLQDLLDDQTGELTKLKTRMVGTLLYNEIVRAFVVGDGRSKPETGADNRMFDGTRGIWSFKADLDRAKGSGKEDIDEYSRAVATVIKNTEGDNSYDKAVKSLRGLKTGGEKVIFAAPGFLTGIMLAKDDQGRYQFGAGTDAESLLKATVYEEDFMEGCGYDVIAVACEGVLYANGNDMIRTDFDHDYNKDVFLQEKGVSGTLQGFISAVGYASADVAAAKE